jgi:hypothetical protein
MSYRNLSVRRIFALALSVFIIVFAVPGVVFNTSAADNPDPQTYVDAIKAMEIVSEDSTQEYTENDRKQEIENEIALISNPDGFTTEVTVENYVAPVNGTVSNINGTAGSALFSVIVKYNENTVATISSAETKPVSYPAWTVCVAAHNYLANYTKTFNSKGSSEVSDYDADIEAYLLGLLNATSEYSGVQFSYFVGTSISDGFSDGTMNDFDGESATYRCFIMYSYSGVSFSQSINNITIIPQTFVIDKPLVLTASGLLYDGVLIGSGAQPILGSGSYYYDNSTNTLTLDSVDFITSSATSLDLSAVDGVTLMLSHTNIDQNGIIIGKDGKIIVYPAVGGNKTESGNGSSGSSGNKNYPKIDPVMPVTPEADVKAIESGEFTETFVSPSGVIAEVTKDGDVIAGANKSGSLNSNSTIQALKAAAEEMLTKTEDSENSETTAAKTVTIITGQDVNAVSGNTLKKIIEAANEFGVDAEIRNSQYSFNENENTDELIFSITIPVDSENIRDIKLGVQFDTKTIEASKKAFEKSFGNTDCVGFSLAQKDTFGVSAKIQVKASAIGFEAKTGDTVYVAIFDPKTGEFIQIEGAIEENGFISFNTDKSGVVVISSEPFVK